MGINFNEEKLWKSWLDHGDLSLKGGQPWMNVSEELGSAKVKFEEEDECRKLVEEIYPLMLLYDP